MTAAEPRTASPRIHRDTGLLVGARQVLSPHHDSRPEQDGIDLIVVHGISLPPGEFGGPWIDQFFCGDLRGAEHAYFVGLAGVRVSAHVCIDRQGQICQYVPFHRRAWHAGVSRWRGREACNDFSIGIELEGTDEVPYGEPQYLALAALVLALQRCYPTITDDHVVGHFEIAPGRKTDPGVSFDWTRLRSDLQAKRGI